MNAIWSFQLEYNIRAFFRDRPFIREKTFLERTITYAFKDTGIWPVSFKAIKAKINEYEEKKKQK